MGCIPLASHHRYPLCRHVCARSLLPHMQNADRSVPCPSPPAESCNSSPGRTRLDNLGSLRVCSHGAAPLELSARCVPPGHTRRRLHVADHGDLPHESTRWGTERAGTRRLGLGGRLAPERLGGGSPAATHLRLARERLVRRTTQTGRLDAQVPAAMRPGAGGTIEAALDVPAVTAALGGSSAARAASVASAVTRTGLSKPSSASARAATKRESTIVYSKKTCAEFLLSYTNCPCNS